MNVYLTKQNIKGNDPAKGFNLKARKGYLLGQSAHHAEGVYAIHMADTNRVVHTMNVIFHENEHRAPPDMPIQLTFDMRTNEPVQQLDSCTGCKGLFKGQSSRNSRTPQHLQMRQS